MKIDHTKKEATFETIGSDPAETEVSQVQTQRVFQKQVFFKHGIFLFTVELGDNCIQKFHFGSYIVGNTIRNLVIQ